MMQHIAPLQTDIAAKPSADVSFDMEKQWLGSDPQQQHHAENNADFGQVLDQQRQASNHSTDKGVNDKSVSKQADESVSQSKSAPNNDDGNSNVATSKEPIKETAEKTKALDLEQKAHVAGDENSEDSIVNWVALVEEVKNLTQQSAQIIDEQANLDETVWDGEIAEMVAIEDNIAIIKHTELSPVYTIELPAEQVDALVSGDAEKVVGIASETLKQLLGEETVTQTDGDKLQTIPNDLYVAPIEVNDTNDIEQLAEDSSLLTKLIADMLNKQGETSKDASSDKQGSNATSDTAAVDDVIVTDNDVQIEIDESQVSAENVNILSQLAGVNASSSDTSPAKSTKSIKLDTSEANALKSLINMDSEQRKIVVEDVATRVSNSLPEAMNGAQQQSFIAALQAGLDEYSKQLQQGREPGLSVKALIAEALANAEVSAEKLPAQQLSQLSGQLTQTLNVTDALRSSLNDSASQLQSMSRAEMGSIDVSSQTESNKQAQLAQVLDKPANILRPEGQNQFAEKIRWIVNARNSFAEIRLDPPDLGSVQVKVSTAGETATVSFVVQSQQARDALEQATPRLRDMLAEQGIELGQSSVQQENQQQQEQEQDGQFAQNKGDDGMEELAGEVIEQRATGGVAGGIDFYA